MSFDIDPGEIGKIESFDLPSPTSSTPLTHVQTAVCPKSVLDANNPVVSVGARIWKIKNVPVD